MATPLDYQANSAAKLENTLMQCELVQQTYAPQFISKLLAEYGVTATAPCVWCGTEMPYFDCVDDMKIVFPDGVTCCLDENEKIRFVVDEVDEKNDEATEILCVGCAGKWKCVVCGYQALSHNFDTNIGTCEAPLCVECCGDMAETQAFWWDTMERVFCPTCKPKKYKK